MNYVATALMLLAMIWLLLASIDDVRTRRIPNAYLALALPFAVAAHLFYEGLNPGGALSSVLGGAAYLASMLALAIITRGVGGGDVKMGGVIGLALGWPAAMLAFAASWIAAGLVGATMRKRSLPMAPLLLGGAIFGLAITRL